MKQLNWFLFVLILILFKCRNLYGQLNACNLNTIDYGQNICDTSNYLVYIIQSSCGTDDDTNCWCILVDNRNQIYDGQQVEMEVDEAFRVTPTRAIRSDPDLTNKQKLKYTITPGINQIYLEPYASSSPAPRLVSFKIEANEMCNTLERRKRNAKALQGDRFDNINDCLDRAGYTENSERFCRNDDDTNFVIEKRSIGRGERYWCIRLSNERNRFSTLNRLNISFESRGRHMAWRPSGARIKQDSDDEIFHLDNKRTTIAVSSSFISKSGKLTSLTAVTIDGQSICNYFTPTPTTKSPPPRTTTTTTTFYVPPIQNVVTEYYPVVTPEALQVDRFRNLNDCLDRAGYTENSERFCRNDDDTNFVIEKRSIGRGERYWCIRLSNERNRFSTLNRLNISFESGGRHMAWRPPNANIEQDSDDEIFHLDNKRTTIAVSSSFISKSGKLTSLTAVTIDGQSICNYFTPTPTRKPPLPTQDMVKPNYPVVVFAPPGVAETSEPQNKPTFNQNCGIKPTKPVTLIIHGASTTPGEWPWHAAIYKLKSKTNRKYSCGGTLIDRKTIITAAHCVHDLNLITIPDRIIVELGRHDLSTATSAIQEFKVFDVKPHELYNPDTIENDIAILVLANYVQLTTYVNFICLPQANMELQKKIGKTVGWGLDENNQLQTELKEASMPVIDNIVCLSSNREFFGIFLTDTNFCAGYPNNTNVCRGDSGGGLVFNIGKQWFLGGVTSLGVASKSTVIECDITQYAIFTDVTKFVSWIKQNS